MWWLLIITLWGTDPSMKPQSLQPIAFGSQALCDKAANAILPDLAAQKPDSVAGITGGCLPISNPTTEKSQ